ncbi:alpha/beta fold hydrolase [Saccharothrix luteola]|uniref:alpha/beta fold hydrolase n=1 Tax=Saccharothrix luteola TaxID=2893018 RepID=UPI001E5960FF|nr:alpha/beta hydrolase [Saccharothrix luteola]MCC8249778.1 alpha/beta hydrolase [Saccharothrix luteola]
MDNDVYKVGEGDHAVIALHGWFGSATAWQPITPYLDGAAFSYFFPDYRGYGARMDVPGEYSIAEAAADVLTFADDLGLEAFSLIGHSMGGSVMQRVLADAPSRVRALVGISPVPASGVPFDEQTWELFAGAEREAGNRRAIIDFTTGNRLSGTWLDAMVRHSLETADPVAFGAYLRAWARTDFQAQVDGNPVPVRVVAGAHDPALGPDTMRATFGKCYPNCEVVVFEQAGHYAVDETPIALVSTVEEFLSEPRGR